MKYATLKIPIDDIDVETFRRARDEFARVIQEKTGARYKWIFKSQDNFIWLEPFE